MIIGGNVEGPGLYWHIGTLPAVAWMEWGKPRRSSVRIA